MVSWYMICTSVFTVKIVYSCVFPLHRDKAHHAEKQLLYDYS